MIGIIIIGHGDFAQGYISAADMIVGSNEKVVGLEFRSNESIDELQDELETTIERLSCHNYIIFTDLYGGTPFKAAAYIAMKRGNMEIFSGTNMLMFIQAILMMEKANVSFVDLVQEIKEIGINGIKLLSELSWDDKK